TGDLTRATELIQAAVGPAPKDFRDLLLRARLREAMHQDKDAEEDYHAATEAAPREPIVWVGYVLYLANHDRGAEALPLVKNDVPAKLPKERVALTVAECYEVLSLPKDAAVAYDAALKERPDDPAVVRSVTAYRLRTG